MCECTVGVDVGDGTTTFLKSILSNIVMGCIVLGRQMNVDFGTINRTADFLFLLVETKEGGGTCHVMLLVVCSMVVQDRYRTKNDF